MRKKFLLMACFLGVGAFAETNVLTAQYLETLRATVRAEHPSVAAAQARLRAAEATIRGVRLWEDPMVGLGVMAAETAMRRDDGDVMFSVEQTLPRRRLYQAERARARAERSMNAAEVQSIILKLETMAAQTAIELALADEMVGINTNHVSWLESMAVNARERVKDPMAMNAATEALRIESELAMERQHHHSNVLLRRRLQRQLNILLGRPADQSWPHLKLPAEIIVTPSIETELAGLVERNPMLRAALSSAEMARSEIDVAKGEAKPVFSVGVDSRVYSGGNFRESTVGARMSIPLFNRSVYRANIEKAREQRESAEKEIAALERELRSQAVAAYTDAENAALQAQTFAKEVIPRARMTAESAQNAWISSKAMLLEALEARRAVLNAELEQRRFVAEHQAALETLRSIVPPKSNP